MPVAPGRLSLAGAVGRAAGCPLPRCCCCCCCCFSSGQGWCCWGSRGTEGSGLAHALIGGLQSRHSTAERLGQGQDEARAAGSAFQGAAGVGAECFGGTSVRGSGPKWHSGTFPRPFFPSRGKVCPVPGWQRGGGLPVRLCRRAVGRRNPQIRRSPQGAAAKFPETAAA